MRKPINRFSRILCAFVICAGFVQEPSGEAVHPYVQQSDLDVSSATDLSSSASANCYIVSEPGLYKFMTVKGNSTASVGSVSSAAILWESFGTADVPEMCDLISAFCYKDGYILFQTADDFRKGNAVIAAKDASGNILWSWHIWFTSPPHGQEYYNDAGTMMDRNLGATSVIPGDARAIGLLYQWGRKDPFLGSSSISSSTLAKSTITWPAAVSSDSSTGTIEYATANPTTLIVYNDDNYDWYYTDSPYTDKTRWTTSDNAKSIYDPCPAGWRVPDGGSEGVWAKALDSPAQFYDASLYNEYSRGMNFSGRFGAALSIWYPVSGCYNYGDGSLCDVGNLGFYWSATSREFSLYNACRLLISFHSSVYPSDFSVRAHCGSVRCIQE